MNIFQKKMRLIANVFPKLRTPKNAVRKMSKKCRFRVPFNKQVGKRARTLFKSERRQFYHVYWLPSKELSLKKSLLVKCKTLTLFVNTFTAYDQYTVLNREYSKDPIEMQLSQKQKTFSEFFSAFLKSRLNFEHIPKKRWHS